MKLGLFFASLLTSLTLFANVRVYTVQDVKDAVAGYENGFRPEPLSDQEKISGVALAQTKFFMDQLKSGTASSKMALEMVDAWAVYVIIGTQAGEKLRASPGGTQLVEPIEKDLIYFDLLGQPQSLGAHFQGLSYPFYLLKGIQSSSDSTTLISKQIELLLLKWTDQIVELTLAHLYEYKKEPSDKQKQIFDRGLVILKSLGSQRAVEGLFKISQRSFDMGLPLRVDACSALLEGVQNQFRTELSEI